MDAQSCKEKGKRGGGEGEVKRSLKETEGKGVRNEREGKGEGYKEIIILYFFFIQNVLQYNCLQ